MPLTHSTIPTITNPNDLVDLLTQGLRIANQAVISDVELSCDRVDIPSAPYPGTWWDTRPMLDEREHCPTVIEQATQALRWAVDTGLLLRHPLHTHLVCVPIQAG